MGSPLRFLMKSSSFILRSALTLGLYMSVLRRMMAKARMKMVSGFRNWRTRAGLHTQYRWLQGRRGQGQGQAPVISTDPPSSQFGTTNPLLREALPSPLDLSFSFSFAKTSMQNSQSLTSTELCQRIYVYVLCSPITVLQGSYYSPILQMK